MSADHTVAIIGVGPRGLSVLERLVALASARWPRSRGPIVIHLIDPHPPGAGIVWRTDQPASLLMNTTIGEQTIFPDSSCSFLAEAAATVTSDTAGPHDSPPGLAEAVAGPAPTVGPTMAEWYRANGGAEDVDATFPSRTLYGQYLRDAYAQIRAAAPDFVEIVEHRTTVDSVIDLPSVDLPGEDPAEAVPPQLVRCEDGTTIIAAAVVLAVGHIPSAQTDERARLAAHAQRSGGIYIPQSLPAEAPLAEVPAGARIIVRGMGLNYFDVQTLLTIERGGRFTSVAAADAAVASAADAAVASAADAAGASGADAAVASGAVASGADTSQTDAAVAEATGSSGADASQTDTAVASTDASADAPATGPASPGAVRYKPSGDEPLLFLGSRRGIPYRSKPISPEHPRTTWPLRYFTKDNVALLASLDDLDGEARAAARFNDQLWPLILADLRFAYYRTLAETDPSAFADDPGRLREAIAEAVSRHLTRRTWQEIHPQESGSDASAESSRHGRVTREAFAWAEIEEELVPDSANRMSLRDLLDPLDGREFSSREPGVAGSLHEWMLDFLRADLRDSLAGPHGSPVKSLFMVLWQARLLLKDLIAAGHIDPVSVDMEIRGWFENFVSGICDGPPPRRIAELIALAEAGVVRFIGPDMHIVEHDPSAEADAGAGNDPLPQVFAVTSARVRGAVTGSVVIDAASPTNSVALADDVLIHGMVDRGQLTAARLTLDDGREKRLSGLALTPRPYRTIDVQGTVHPRRFALSIQLSSMQWGLAIAANPEADAATLADSHAAASAILDLI